MVVCERGAMLPRPPPSTMRSQVSSVGLTIVRLPCPPPGMGLVHMKNDSRFPVYVFVGGEDKGLVAPGAWTDLVLPPGTHKLEVRIEGIEARTEHTVTLLANQAAEWVWGTDK